MVDRVKIYVKAGEGGAGCNSFKRGKSPKIKYPNGGDGGRGADIVARVNSSSRSLEYFQYQQHFRAEHGKRGQANDKKGAEGRPCIIMVPPGTVIYDIGNHCLLGELIAENDELILARGGLGGRGNTKTRAATTGSLGGEKQLLLELKSVADIAIIGYPNSGKSSLLRRVTTARTKVADYPFTTTAPSLGVLTFTDFAEPANLTLIEIPALIKGAKQGKGLGTQFLRHAERSKILVHLIDLAPARHRDPIQDYYDLNNELKLYSLTLAKKPQLLVANKIDLAQAKSNLSKFTNQIQEQVYPISALSAEGIDRLLQCLRNCFRQLE